MEINERILRSKEDQIEFERLLAAYRPFVASCASRVAGRYIDEHDDEMSIALIAFLEAVQRFEPETGKFLSYARQIIRCRLVDELRKKGRAPVTVSLDGTDNDEEDTVRNEMNMTCRLESELEDPVKLEIDMLSGALKAYGFGFMDIVKWSPKHSSTKQACLKAVRCVIGDIKLLRHVKQARQLPVQAIEKITGISRKIIGRHRNYIVCLVEIISGDYSYLAEYVKFVKEAE